MILYLLEKDGAFRFLIPVDVIPGEPISKSVYDNILQEFVKSGLQYAMVKDLGKKAKTIWLSLNYRKKRLGITDVDVTVRNKKVYLERISGPILKDLPNQINEKENLFSRNDTVKTLTSLKPSIETIDLGNTIIFKLKCPKCNALNSKDSRRCRDCGSYFFETEQDFINFATSVERLENELNRTRDRI